MNSVVRTFADRINRQRLRPRLWDYTYLLLRANVAAFEAFRRRLRQDGPARILDVGCGFKPWLPFLPPGVTCYGVDYSSQWSSADALSSGDALPFPAASFDAVICSEVLEHTRYPERVVQELRRVCRPGGLIYLTSPFAFHEHGIPYDFQRLTRYFYREVFRDDTIHLLQESNSTFSTGLTCLNMFIESSPLRLAYGLKNIVYAMTNLLGLTADRSMELLLPRLARSYKLYFYNLPLGYAVVVEVRKSGESGIAIRGKKES